MRKIHAETMSTHEPDPYEELAIGIIRQAADDYRRLCQKKQNTDVQVEIDSLEQQIQLIRKFFGSRWFCVLSGLDSGVEILCRLEEEINND